MIKLSLLKKYKGIILYGVFGILTTLINIIIFKVFRDFFGTSIAIANLIAWFFAVLFAYLTNREWVFSSSNKNKFLEACNFYIARIATLIIETIILYFLIQMLGVDELISKVLSNVVVIILNYIFSKLFVFKQKS